jgi:hypothetical protein
MIYMPVDACRFIVKHIIAATRYQPSCGMNMTPDLCGSNDVVDSAEMQLSSSGRRVRLLAEWLIY